MRDDRTTMMSPAFTTRRRSEEFNSLVEDSSTGRLPDGTRHADLLALVATLRSEPAPEPRPAFVVDLRSRLMLAAETALAPDATAQRATRPAPAPRTKRERRIAVAVGGFAIVSATTSMAVAAQSALPGDTLYPLKRGIENAQVSVQAAGDDKGTTLLHNATGRLEEVDELSRSGSDNGQDISTTLDDFASQANEASKMLLSDYVRSGRVTSLEELRGFASSSMKELTALEDVVPVVARGSLIEAARILNQIDQQAMQACPSCTSSAVTQAPLFTAATRTLLDPLAKIVGIDAALPGTRKHHAPKKNAHHQDTKPTKNSKGDSGPTKPSNDVRLAPKDDKPPAKSSSLPTSNGGNEKPVDKPGVIDKLLGGLGGRETSVPSGGKKHGPKTPLDGVGDLLDDTGNAVDKLLGGLGSK